jgi:hypothetical protein
MQKGRGKKLGQQQTEKSIDVGTKNKGWARPEALVQGRLEGCPIREALRKTSGRKARNALLQTIKACKLKKVQEFHKRKVWGNQQVSPVE